MIAEITYNAGRSYRIGSAKFLKGKTKTIKNSDLIKRCQSTIGFCVRMLEPEKPEKPKRVMRQVAEEEPKTFSRPKKKKTSSKRRSSGD